jgi:hypothetical protein
MKSLIYGGKILTPKDIEYAESFFNLGELKPQSFEVEPEPMDIQDFEERLKLKTNQKEIVELGTKTYLDLTRGMKKFLINSDKIKVGKPNKNWINQNISDLEFFRDNLSFTEQKFVFDKKEKRTINEQINFLLERLKKQDFYGVLEKEGDEFVWSILNKINSNYSNWNHMIIQREMKGDLGPKNLSIEQKIKNYFEQTSYNKDDFDVDEETFLYLKRHADTMSLADLDILEAINSKDEQKKAGQKIDKIISNLKKTTEKGDKTEEQFVKWLIDKGYDLSHIRNFSSPGNLVDITFQTDLLLLGKNGWIPIQVKSSDKYTKLLSYKIAGACLIYPQGKRWVKKYKNIDGLEQKKFI